MKKKGQSFLQFSEILKELDGKLQGGFEIIAHDQLISILGGSNNCQGGNCVAGCGSTNTGCGTNTVSGCHGPNTVQGCGTDPVNG